MRLSESPTAMFSPEAAALHREDIALRVFCAMVSGGIRHDDVAILMRESFRCADLFLTVAEEERARINAAMDARAEQSVGPV